MAKIIIVWGLWGPYHCRRLESLRRLGQASGQEVVGVSLFSGSRVNGRWRPEQLPAGVVHANFGPDETRLPIKHIGSLLSLPRRLQAEVALLPAYHHWSLLLNAGARLAGARVVMMNETHAGTARATGLKATFKQQVVARFHAALVGGQPQRRYFASLGLPTEKIFTGYDAVDNDYFAHQAAEVRRRDSEFRNQYDLPDHFFLSLGRFVAKKNLGVLIRAYRRFLEANPQAQTHLVMVGSGEEDASLRALCAELRLPVYEKSDLHNRDGEAVERQLPIVNETPGVHFYGFRQIDENPIFYGLADAFILPSLYEEWGLVVNEAMACGLPVIVSETAGCAEDLLVPDRLAIPPESPAELRMHLVHLTGRIRQNGFLFNPASVHQLAKALLVLEAAPAIRENMGQASRRIVEDFSCENFAVNALRAAEAALGGPQLKVNEHESSLGHQPLKV
jgi:glycosyltransferase involved in cell wall biosynthesis